MFWSLTGTTGRLLRVCSGKIKLREPWRIKRTALWRDTSYWADNSKRDYFLYFFLNWRKFNCTGSPGTELLKQLHKTKFPPCLKFKFPMQIAPSRRCTDENAEIMFPYRGSRTQLGCQLREFQNTHSLLLKYGLNLPSAVGPRLVASAFRRVACACIQT